MGEKTPNHKISEMSCPHELNDVDLFSPGAQEHWYEAYDILYEQAPVHCIPGEEFEPDTDAFILSKHEDIALVVRDEHRFPVVGSVFLTDHCFWRRRFFNPQRQRCTRIDVITTP